MAKATPDSTPEETRSDTPSSSRGGKKEKKKSPPAPFEEGNAYAGMGAAAVSRELVALRKRVAEYEVQEAARLVAAADDGVVTAAKMRKVMGQDAVMDSGPTERRLREWLDRGIEKFDARVRELEAEEAGIEGMRVANAVQKKRIAELEGEVDASVKRLREMEGTGEDHGSAKAREMIVRILTERKS